MNATVDTVWADQARWSAVGNKLKHQITVARSTALILGILGALFATVASQLNPKPDPAVKPAVAQSRIAPYFSIASAVSLAAVASVARRFSPMRVEEWTRARSVAEALKQEMYLFLTGAKPYNDNNRIKVLTDHAQGILAKADDLAKYAATVEPKVKPLPTITKPEDYINLRVMQQVNEYYLRKAYTLGRRLSLAQGCAACLTIGAALLSAFAGFSHTDWIGAWVAVATTVAGAILAHAAAARYEHNVTAYFSTARQLKYLAGVFGDALKNGTTPPDAYDEFVHQCEEIISIENQGWMADWHRPADPNAPANPGR